ncbi:MAG TPA: hypothetical protein VM008_11870 [Phycisphaerae bacterium]|nr:hypothetical protein [Phycisphaerae bacterium]
MGIMAATLTQDDLFQLFQPTPEIYVDPAAARAFAKYVHDRVHHVSFGWLKSDGTKRQNTRVEVQQFLQSCCSKKWGIGHIPMPKLRRLTQEILGSGEVVYVRGDWQARECLVRLDVDTHHDELDGPALMTWLLEQIGMDLPVAESQNGLSAWVWLRVPTNEKGIPTMKREDMNALIHRFGAALSVLARQAGFLAKVELQGGFLDSYTKRDQNGMPLSLPELAEGALDGKYAAKISAKYFPMMNDVEKLKNACISIEHPRLLDIIERARTLIAAAEKAKAEATAKQEAWRRQEQQSEEAKRREMGLSGRRPEHRSHCVADRGDKLANTRESILNAKHCLGIRTREELEEQQEEVLELAHRQYIDSGLGDSHVDSKRRQRFRDAFMFVLRTHRDDAAGSGGDGPWFTVNGDDSDLARLQARMTGCVSGGTIAAANAELRRGGHPLVTREKLALVALTMAKNVSMNKEGDCPARAVLRMLQHHGMSASGSTVRLLMGVIRRLGLFEMIRECSEGVCRAYRIVRRAWFSFLPQDHGCAEQPASEPVPAGQGAARACRQESAGSGGHGAVGQEPPVACRGPVAEANFPSIMYCDGEPCSGGRAEGLAGNWMGGNNSELATSREFQRQF